MSNELNKMRDLVLAGQLSRRDFIAGAAAIGITASAASTLLSSPAKAAPKKGGHFKIGIGSGSTTESLDPGAIDNTFPQQVNYAMRNCLVDVEADGSAVPNLAESVEASSDAKTWTVKLRKGVEFHNGKTMTADDVIASMNHHRGEDSKSAAKSVLDPVVDIKKDDDHTITFELKEGNADFPYIISDYHLSIMPDGKWEEGIGTGGYVLENFEPGVKATFKRFANYWRGDERAHFDSIETLSIKDVAARTNALTSGEVHAMDRCDLKTVHLLKRNRKLNVHQVTGTQHYTIPMHVDVAPFDSQDVRLALKYGIDREAIVKTVLRGYGQVANDHPISPANKYFNKELPQRAYDPDKARFHLKQAGVDSISVDLSSADAAFAGAVDAAVLYKEHAAKAGININVIREPNDGYWSNVWLKKPFCFCYWGGRPTEDWMFSIAYSKGAAWNDTHWENERFNKLLVEARAELDDSKRRAMYYEMQELCSNDGGTVVPMYASYVFATAANVGHDTFASNWDLDGNKALERWWFDS